MLQIQLFIDTGTGFAEPTSLSRMIQMQATAQDFVFDLSDRNGLTGLRLDPLDDRAVLVIEQIVLVGDDHEIDLSGRLQSNGQLLLSEPHCYFFGTTDPQLYFEELDARELSGARALRARIRYISPGKNLLEPLHGTHIFDEALLHYRAQIGNAGDDEITVCDVVSAKAWCEKTAAPYHLVSQAEEIVAPYPKFIGEEIIAGDGVTYGNELYVAELSHARILSKSDAILVGDNTLLYGNLTHVQGENVYLSYEHAIKYHNLRKVLIDYTGYSTLRAERGILMAGITSHHFGHWFLEYLPKMKLFDAVPDYNDYPLYVDEGMPPTHYQSLELMAEGKRQIIKISANTSILFDRLIVAPTFTFIPYNIWPGTPLSVHTGPASPAALAYLQEKFLGLLQLDSNPIPADRKGRRLFVGRNLLNGRKLTNELEIQTFLAEFGFEVVFTEQLTFEQQVRIFNEAEWVIGPSGSAFANVSYCKKGTKVIMFGKSYTSNAAAWINAVEKLGHQHLFVAGQMIATPGIEHHSDFMVPLNLVKQALDYFGMDN